MLLPRTILIAFALLSFMRLEASTFVYCSEGSPSSFNPQLTTDGTSSNASAKTVYDRLVHFKYGTTEVIPGLASSWEISKDKKSYTFKLRPNVSFHTTSYFTPKRTLNADDVIFSINRQRVKDHPYHSVGGGNYEYFEGMEMASIIKDVRKTDDLTVVIELTKPEAPFLANLAMGFMSILSAEYAAQLVKEDKKENLDTAPIGTGPFVFTRYQKDNIIRFKKFNNYWGDKAKSDNLVFVITPEPSVRYQKLKNGECHLIIEPAPADIENMKKEARIKLLSGAGLNVGYLAMNVQKKPFDNKLVREAINHALNKEAYIKAIYHGHAEVAKNPLPPTIWSYNENIKPYDYNPELAKKLLKEAGYPNGFESEIWTLPVTRPYNPNGKKMGEMMQEDLARVGIKVKLVSYDWPTYLKKSRDGDHQMIQMGWTGDNGDPDNFLAVLLGCAAVEAGSNLSRWCNKDFEALISKAKLSTELEERAQLYKKAQEIFHREAPWVPLAHSTIFRAMSSDVEGYKIDPLGHDIFTLTHKH